LAIMARQTRKVPGIRLKGFFRVDCKGHITWL
jgi:hypothetical protein